jgi:hypothetical protein
MKAIGRVEMAYPIQEAVKLCSGNGLERTRERPPYLLIHESRKFCVAETHDRPTCPSGN